RAAQHGPARDVRLRSSLDRIQDVAHDPVAARTGAIERVLQAAIDTTGEGFAKEAARLGVARAYRRFGDLERRGGFLDRQFLQSSQYEHCTIGVREGVNACLQDSTHFA